MQINNYDTKVLFNDKKMLEGTHIDAKSSNIYDRQNHELRPYVYAQDVDGKIYMCDPYDKVYFLFNNEPMYRGTHMVIRGNGDVCVQGIDDKIYMWNFRNDRKEVLFEDGQMLKRTHIETLQEDVYAQGTDGKIYNFKNNSYKVPLFNGNEMFNSTHIVAENTNVYVQNINGDIVGWAQFEKPLTLMLCVC